MFLHHLFKRELEYFSPTCPSESQWYACTTGSKFVGCCTTDPCSNGCAQGNIQPVSFNASSYGTFPDASCGASSNFYSCKTPDNSTTFWGCCKSMPCDTYKCPSADLVPAFMERPEQFDAYATSAPSATSAAPSATGTSNAGAKQEASHTGAIVGGAVGGGLGLAVIIALLIFFLCRRKRRNRTEKSAPDGASMAEKNDCRASTHTEAPPLYTSPNPNTYPRSQSPSGYAHNYQQVTLDPQELPAHMPPTAGSPSLQPPPITPRYSELPADAETLRTAELESPMPSPAPTQSGFAPTGPTELEVPRQKRVDS